MAKKFTVLRSGMSPASRARAETKYRKLATTYAQLQQLREELGLTQEQLAGEVGISQAAISKLERRSDMQVSTLKTFVEALGGHLRITAVMPDGKERELAF